MAKQKEEPKITQVAENDKPATKIKGGKGMMNGSTGKKFSKDYQPDPAKSLATRMKKKNLREFLAMSLGKGKLPKDINDFLNTANRVYGIKKEEVDVRLLMEMRLAYNAIQTGDVAAYKAIMDRAFGKPMQEQAPVVDVPQEDGERTKFVLPNGIEFEI